MNILMLSGDFYPKTSGGARDDWKFARAAAAEGHDVLVYADKVEGSERRERKDGVEIRRPYRMRPENDHLNSPRGQLRRIATTVLLFVRLFLLPLRRDISVVYSTNHALHPVAKVIGLVYRIPVVNYIAYSPSINEDDPSKPKSVFVFERLIFTLFLGDLVLSRTPQVERKVRRLSSAETRLVHGILDMSDVRSVDLTRSPDPGGDEVTQLVYVARLVPIKNPAGALSVLEALPETYHLWLVGDGQERAAVEREVRERGLEDRVELLGELPHQETLRYISAADALVLTSYTEAYPTVVFEALSLRTPVHATPVGILPEIDHDRLALASVDALSEQILSAEPRVETGVDDETLERYSMERFAKATLGALEDVQH